MKKSAKKADFNKLSDLNFDFENSAQKFTELPEWPALERSFAEGKYHCAAVTAPLEWHEGIVFCLSEMFLGLKRAELKGSDDLIILGELERAPKIDECRDLIRDIALKPVSSPKNRRLAVIMSADKLLKPAANSLLKLSEEPPAHACILFMLDIKGRKLMPTLKSRSAFVVLKDLKKDFNNENYEDKDYNNVGAEFSPELKELKEPENDKEWLDFTAKFRELDYLKAAAALGKMAERRLERGGAENVRRAARLERLRIIASTRRLSAAMLCDLVMLSLKGGMPVERVFNDI